MQVSEIGVPQISWARNQISAMFFFLSRQSHIQYIHGSHPMCLIIESACCLGFHPFLLDVFSAKLSTFLARRFCSVGRPGAGDTPKNSPQN